MKIWKQNILVITIVVLLMLLAVVQVASAESEGTGDLFNWHFSEDQWGFGKYGDLDHPNIDITDVSYTKEGLELTLSVTVAGTIQDSLNYYYVVYSGNPDGVYYSIALVAALAAWNANGISGVASGLLTDYISDDGKTFSGTITMLEDTTITPYANAIEYQTFGDAVTSEWWQDWFPNSYFTIGDPGDGDGDRDGDVDTGDGSGNGGTPGFKLITLVAAVAVALILLKRRK